METHPHQETLVMNMNGAHGRLKFDTLSVEKSHLRFSESSNVLLKLVNVKIVMFQRSDETSGSW